MAGFLGRWVAQLARGRPPGSRREVVEAVGRRHRETAGSGEPERPLVVGGHLDDDALPAFAQQHVDGVQQQPLDGTDRRRLMKAGEERR